MAGYITSFPGDHSKCEPPDPISNSEVKPLRADDSVGSPHVKVGHRQDLNEKPQLRLGFFYAWVQWAVAYCLICFK
jgi:hypothetical protein